MEANQEENTEIPRLRVNPSKRDTLPQSLSAADGNNTSMKNKYKKKCYIHSYVFIFIRDSFLKLQGK